MELTDEITLILLQNSLYYLNFCFCSLKLDDLQIYNRFSTYKNSCFGCYSNPSTYLLEFLRGRIDRLNELVMLIYTYIGARVAQ